MRQILAGAELTVRAARSAVHEVECCSRPGRQLAHIRSAVVDIRRVTFVLQTTRNRVEGFDDWYSDVQAEMRGDQLMRYFVELRNEVEKRGLPGAIAELYRTDTGEAIADVTCYEDQHGLAVSGAVRPDVSLPRGDLVGAHGLRNFRLPDPPRLHQGETLVDLRFAALAGLALDYLEAHVLAPAKTRFADPE